MIRILLLSFLSLCAVSAADLARIDPTVVDRIQASIDQTTGKVERLEIYDANTIMDSVGGIYKTPLRVTVVLRAQAPALFAAVLAKTTERDEAQRARKAADDAARAASVGVPPRP